MIDLLRTFEARTRMAAALEKRDKISTENFVRCIVDIGKAEGFDLANGDKAILHPEDIPESVKLDDSHPIIISKGRAVVKGQMMFTPGSRIGDRINTPPLITQRTETQ